MSSYQLISLVLAGFAGGLAFGMTGFAYGVIVSLILLNFFPHQEVVFIIVLGGTILNLSALPRFWSSVDLRGALPYLIGATAGVPLGFFVLQSTDTESIKTFSIIFIFSYCVFALTQVKNNPFLFGERIGQFIDGVVGFLGGVIGGLSGLGPLLPSIWYGMRGHKKDVARGLTQVFGIYVQGLTLTIFLLKGGIPLASIPSLSPLIPAILLGSWLGLKVFDSMSTLFFKKIVIWFSLSGSLLMLVTRFAK